MLTIGALAFTLACYAAMRAAAVLEGPDAAGRPGGLERALAVLVLAGGVLVVLAMVVDFLTLRPLIEYLQEVVQVIQDVGT